MSNLTRFQQERERQHDLSPAGEAFFAQAGKHPRIIELLLRQASNEAIFGAILDSPELFRAFNRYMEGPVAPSPVCAHYSHEDVLVACQ